MDHQFNQRRFLLADNLEKRRLADGTLLLKQKSCAEYLALTPAQQRVLDRFDGKATVQEILSLLLLDPSGLGIRGFYDFVLPAVAHGFLIDEDNHDGLQTPPLRGRRWGFGWGFGLALFVFVVASSAGCWVFSWSDLRAPATVGGWVWTLILVSLILSVADLTAGCVLRGFGCLVYRPRISFDRGLPHFSIDTRDAFMGGRLCQAGVALQQLAMPFLFGIAGYLFGSGILLFAAALAALALTSPFGQTPAHRLLHATFRRAYQLPYRAATFLKRRLFWYLARPKCTLREEPYLVLYSAYAIAWLGMLILFGARLCRHQGYLLAHEMLNAPGADTKIVAAAVLVLLVSILFTPLVYELWLLAGNTFALVAPYWFRAEAAIRKLEAPASRPDTETLVAFLRKTQLFHDLSEADLLATATAMSFVDVPADTLIIREGDPGDILFVVYTGSVTVTKDDPGQHTRMVARLTAGDVFGEIALLDRVPRTATVRSIEKVTLLVLPRQDFERILITHVGVERVKTIVQVCGFLKRIRMFTDWPGQGLLRLARNFEFVAPARGDSVIAQGAPNSAFYLIYEGSCDVVRDGRQSAHLGRGEFFGEISLLKRVPAVASVIAAEPTRCLRLDHDRFFDFIAQDILTGIVIEKTMETRLRRNQTS